MTVFGPVIESIGIGKARPSGGHVITPLEIADRGLRCWDLNQVRAQRIARNGCALDHDLRTIFYN